METEKSSVIDTIKKLLSLADKSRNTNVHETEAAALKAQELMAKHNIDIREAEEGGEEEIPDYKLEECDSSRKWKHILSSIVAKNFRCRCFWRNNTFVAFYGFKADVEASHEVYKFLFKMGNRLAKKECREARNENGYADRVYNTFISGFLRGLSSKFDEQCVALAIVTPPEVEKAYEEFSKNFKRSSHTITADRRQADVYQRGFEAGKSALGARGIECSNC